MKKRSSLQIGIAAAFLLLSLQNFAQSALAHVPEGAQLVVSLNGKSMTDKVSLQELDNMPIMQAFFKEMFRGSEVNKFEDTGVDWTKRLVYFMNITDTAMVYGMVMPLANEQTFRGMVAEQQERPYSTMSDLAINYTKDGYVKMCNVDLNLNGRDYKEFQDRYDLERLDSEQNGGRNRNSVREYEEDLIIYDDDMDMVEPEPMPEIEEALPPPPPKVPRDKKQDEDLEIIDEPVEEIEIIEDDYEIVEDDYEIMEAPPRDNYDDYGYEEPAYRSWYGGMPYEQEKILEEIWAKNYAERLNTGAKMMTSVNATIQAKALNADVVCYLDLEDVFNEIQGRAMGYPYGFGLNSAVGTSSLLAGQKTVFTANFNEEDVAVDMYNQLAPRLEEYYKAAQGKKMNKKFGNYLDSKNLVGYYSINSDTKGSLEHYGDLVSSIYGGMDLGGIKPENIFKMLNMLIDEEAIAKVLPGDMMLAFTGLSMQSVEYTSYDYDEDFNYVPKKKTREEMLPDFLFMASNKDRENLENILDMFAFDMYGMGLIKTEYGFRIDAGNSLPFPLHFTIHDGIFFICNDSGQLGDILSGKKSAGLNKEDAKRIKSNWTSMYFDGKKLIDQIPEAEQAMGPFKTMVDESLGMLVLEGKNVKNGMQVTSLKLGLSGEKDNSFAQLMHILNEMVNAGL